MEPELAVLRELCREKDKQIASQQQQRSSKSEHTKQQEKQLCELRKEIQDLKKAKRLQETELRSLKNGTVYQRMRRQLQNKVDVSELIPLKEEIKQLQGTLKSQKQVAKLHLDNKKHLKKELQELKEKYEIVESKLLDLKSDCIQTQNDGKDVHLRIPSKSVQ